MSINVTPPNGVKPLDSLGYFHTSESSTKRNSFHNILNVSNALGYIPGISMITGIARIIFSAMSLMQKKSPSDDYKMFCGLQMARGLIEFSGNGLLLLIPDLIVSFNRVNERSLMDVMNQKIEGVKGFLKEIFE